ncbi:hypothetical protein M9H77_09746 [Catharanthus roseus]|uniref:Uncharacterized protein n=1 Tax=Catharanthus roseus TaxID=4058 RepID=A0ACC0C1H8_CATRO|nr:hypothetical protein M9H77_09746 [Catharanthus roseus]
MVAPMPGVRYPPHAPVYVNTYENVDFETFEEFIETDEARKRAKTVNTYLIITQYLSKRTFDCQPHVTLGCEHGEGRKNKIRLDDEDEDEEEEVPVVEMTPREKTFTIATAFMWNDKPETYEWGKITEIKTTLEYSRLKERDSDKNNPVIAQLCYNIKRVPKILVDPENLCKHWLSRVAQNILHLVIPLYPEGLVSSVPSTVITKGRRKTDSTKRDKSQWEHIQIAHYLKGRSSVGCFGNVHQIFGNLSETYLQPNLSKDILLNPTSLSQIPLLKDNTSHYDSAKCLNKFYTCNNNHVYVTNVRGSACPDCQRYPLGAQTMTRELKYVEGNNNGVAAASSVGITGNVKGYVQGLVMYMVTDDLSVTPMSMVSSITMMNNFKVSKLDVLEERVVKVGMNESLELLKACFGSKAVLTSVFLCKKRGSTVGAN